MSRNEIFLITKCFQSRDVFNHLKFCDHKLVISVVMVIERMAREMECSFIFGRSELSGLTFYIINSVTRARLPMECSPNYCLMEILRPFRLR